MAQQPFIFFTERRLVELTGVKAKNLLELLTGLRTVSGSSIFYHTHHQYLAHHFEKPVVYNQFGRWVSEELQEEALAERLIAVDLLNFTSIRQLREAFIAEIEAHLNDNGGPLRESPRGNEFHFCKSKSFIMSTGIVASDVSDFVNKLPLVTNISIFFHFFQARLRLERRTNDFSLWLSDCGARELAEAIDRLDPYVMTLDELKKEIIDLGGRYH